MFEWMKTMKSILVTCCLALLCGCCNINYRLLGGTPDVIKPYECTSEAIAGCTFITVPQIVNPGPLELCWLNVVTIPIGVCCFVVDIPLELICDTICWPYDKYMTIKHYKSVDPLDK